MLAIQVFSRNTKARHRSDPGIDSNKLEGIMSRTCDLCGKGPTVGYNISHANNKTKRRYLPNLVNVTLTSDAMGQGVRLRISANALRSVDHNGGLDAFLLKARDADLSLRLRRLKKQIAERKAAA